MPRRNIVIRNSDLNKVESSQLLNKIFNPTSDQSNCTKSEKKETKPLYKDVVETGKKGSLEMIPEDATSDESTKEAEHKTDKPRRARPVPIVSVTTLDRDKKAAKGLEGTKRVRVFPQTLSLSDYTFDMVYYQNIPVVILGKCFISCIHVGNHI